MLCIIGGGKMGFALADGILRQQTAPDITIVEAYAARRDELKSWAAEHPTVSVTDTLVPCDGAIIAVKPRDVELAVSDAVGAGAKRVLSIAAGVPLSRLHEWAGGRIPVLRAMPNLGALAGESATALCGGVTAHDEDLSWAESVLASCGVVVRVAEDQMDAVTGLSGSGPAYLFFAAEALIDAGVVAGLPRSVSTELIRATFRGVAELLKDETRPVGEWRADVTTPAGTTAAALRTLEERAVRSAFIDAVLAATERSVELGKQVSH